MKAFLKLQLVRYVLFSVYMVNFNDIIIVFFSQDKLLPVYFAAPSVSEEDEVYEEYVCETNLVYEAVGDKLVEVEKYSRKPLKYCMLQSSKVRSVVVKVKS